MRFSDVAWGLMTDAPLLTITDAAREKILARAPASPMATRWRCGST